MNYMPYCGHIRIHLGDLPELRDETTAEQTAEQLVQMVNNALFENGIQAFEIAAEGHLIVASVVAAISAQEAQIAVDVVSKLPAVGLVYFAATGDPAGGLSFVYPTDLEPRERSEAWRMYAMTWYEMAFAASVTNQQDQELDVDEETSPELQAKLDRYEAAFSRAFLNYLGQLDSPAFNTVVPGDLTCANDLVDALWDLLEDGDAINYLPRGHNSLAIQVFKGDTDPKGLTLDDLKMSIAQVAIGNHPLSWKTA